MTIDNSPKISVHTLGLLESLRLKPPRQRPRYYENQWWRTETILDDFARTCKKHPDKTAIVTYRYDTELPERLSYGALARHVERTAGALRHLGAKPGDVISVQLPNRWQFVVFALATFRIGGILNPVIPIHREQEVGFITSLLGSRIYVCTRSYRDFDYAEMIKRVRPGSPSIQHCIVCDSEEIEDMVSFEKHVLGNAWEEELGNSSSDVTLDPDSIADIQFTSGTTGDPKGVGHTFNTLYARARTVFEQLRLTEADTVFMPSTLAHSTGFVYGCITPIICGMTMVYQDRWDPDRAVEIMAAEDAVWTFGSTTFAVDLVRAQRQRKAALRNFRYFISGGAKIPPAVVAETRAELGGRLIACWGMTENGAVTLTGIDESEEAAAESDGRPCPWMELKIVDPQTNQALGVGAEGKLMVRGASQMIGYVKRPDLTAAAFDDEGWFDTGDLARIDTGGHLRITGRIKDIIIRGGENIPVALLESVLFEHPCVSEIAIVGVPDERLGERACAVVIPADGAEVTLGSITQFLESRGISRSYWPESIQLVKEIPHTSSGKVQKFLLRQTLAE